MQDDRKVLKVGLFHPTRAKDGNHYGRDGLKIHPTYATDRAAISCR